ncbi:hypothetical protein HanPSC8_Chr13g0547591 [Helianthus annuus]|nr:hypothetical protein HanPSC8_Chr13g0547591 [Helianthus annuus]
MHKIKNPNGTRIISRYSSFHFQAMFFVFEILNNVSFLVGFVRRLTNHDYGL